MTIPARDVPKWMATPPGEQCAVAHPTGAATCGRLAGHTSDWHCDPHAEVSWRRYPDETSE